MSVAPYGPSNIAYIGMGGNLGNTASILASALEALDASSGLRVRRASSVYKTEPQGLKEQPFFLNQVAELSCDPGLTPEALLELLLETELAFGRVRPAGEKDGPRSLDLDLLLFGDEERETPCLILPHPRMRVRAFVLVPLAEIAPDLVFPDGTDIRTALANIVFTLRGNEIFQDDQCPLIRGSTD